MLARGRSSGLRRGRNLALLFVLVGLCVLFFAITILKRAGTG